MSSLDQACELYDWTLASIVHRRHVLPSKSREVHRTDASQKRPCVFRSMGRDRKEAFSSLLCISFSDRSNEHAMRVCPGVTGRRLLDARSWQRRGGGSLVPVVPSTLAAAAAAVRGGSC